MTCTEIATWVLGGVAVAHLILTIALGILTTIVRRQNNKTKTTTSSTKTTTSSDVKEEEEEEGNRGSEDNVEKTENDWQTHDDNTSFQRRHGRISLPILEQTSSGITSPRRSLTPRQAIDMIKKTSVISLRKVGSPIVASPMGRSTRFSLASVTSMMSRKSTDGEQEKSLIQHEGEDTVLSDDDIEQLDNKVILNELGNVIGESDV